MTAADYEFERGIPLGARTCDTCEDWLPDDYLAVDECFETLVPDGFDGLEAVPRRTVELMKFCSLECADGAIAAVLDEHHLRCNGEGPGIEPVTPCARCGIPILRLAEHTCLSLLDLEPDHHVVGEQHFGHCLSCVRRVSRR